MRIPGLNRLAVWAALLTVQPVQAQATLRGDAAPVQIAATAACQQAYAVASGAAYRVAELTQGMEHDRFVLIDKDLDEAYILIPDNPDSPLCEARLVRKLNARAFEWHAYAEELVRRSAARVAERVESDLDDALPSSKASPFVIPSCDPQAAGCVVPVAKIGVQACTVFSCVAEGYLRGTR